MNNKITKGKFIAALISVPVLVIISTALKPLELSFDSTNPDFKRVKESTVIANTAQVIDYNFTLQTLDGEEVPFSTFKGKTVFVNLWATWCGPCVSEMPDLQKLYDKVKSEKIEFVMISLDEGNSKPKKFIEKRKYTFPVYRLKSELPDELGTSSIPTTFVISSSGRIKMRQEGSQDYNTQRFVDFLRKI